MLSGLTADKEDQFIAISEAAVHMHRDDLIRQVPSDHVSVHPEHIVFGSAGTASFCDDEISHAGTLKVRLIHQEENDELEDDLLPASTAPMSDPCVMYLREIRSIAMTQQEAERQVRKDLAAAEEHITHIVLHTPHAVREIISLGCKLDSDKVSIREITGAISEEAAELELDFHKNRVNALIRQIKLAEQKKQMLYKLGDCGQPDEARGNVLQQKIDSCTEQQIDLLRKINLSRAVISRIVLTLKQCHRRLQKAREEGRAGEARIKHMEDKTMLDHATFKQTIAMIEEEEKKTFRARQILITAHLGLVVYVAKRYKNSGLDFTDLIQEGNIGLIKAANKFDISKRYHFKSEAIWYIKNAIIKAIINKGKTIRIPDHVFMLMKKLAKASSRLLRETGKEPTVEEIGHIIGIAPEKLCRHSVIQQFVSLNTTPEEGDGKSCLGDLIEDNTCIFPGDVADRCIMHASVKKMMERLNGQEKMVISMRYGIGYESDHTLEKVGQSLSLTRQRVKQIEDRAFNKLLKYSKRNGLGAFIEV